MHLRRLAVALALPVSVLFLVNSPLPATAQLRVATWNITDYYSGRVADIQTVVFGVFETRSMTPDIILAQEMMSNAASQSFLAALNQYEGDPNAWAMVGWLPNTDASLFYRPSKVIVRGSPAVVSYDPNRPQPPRKAVRYVVDLVGYTSPKARLVLYNSHMKAGSTQQDTEMRLTEAMGIRANAQTLNADWNFLLGSDLNTYDWYEAGYQWLVASQQNNDGRFFDPIRMAGTWHDNSAFRFVHTQDPVAAAGGMDDRFDQILMSARLLDGNGLDYLGDGNRPYSTTTWDDSQHSYRVWGNDGTSYNTGLRVQGNSMVGPAIAQAIINTAQGGGHCPVFCDLRVPAEVNSDVELDFGQVPLGQPAEKPLAVWNDGDVALWNAAGIDPLRYTLGATTGFTAPTGSFVHRAGDAENAHIIAMDTGTPGVKTGTLTISSNAPDEPARLVSLRGEVVAGWKRGDLDCDGQVNFGDINPFVLALTGREEYERQYPDCEWLNADCNGDGTVDFADINPFVDLLTRAPVP